MVKLDLVGASAPDPTATATATASTAASSNVANATTAPGATTTTITTIPPSTTPGAAPATSAGGAACKPTEVAGGAAKGKSSAPPPTKKVVDDKHSDEPIGIQSNGKSAGAAATDAPSGPTKIDQEIEANAAALTLLLADFASAKAVRDTRKSAGAKKYEADASEYKSVQALKAARKSEDELADTYDLLAKRFKELADVARKHATKNKKRQKDLLHALEKGYKPQYGFARGNEVDLKQLLPLQTTQEMYDEIVNLKSHKLYA